MRSYFKVYAAPGFKSLSSFPQEGYRPYFIERPDKANFIAGANYILTGGGMADFNVWKAFDVNGNPGVQVPGPLMLQEVAAWGLYSTHPLN